MRWLIDAIVGPKLAARNMEQLESVAVDLGYDSAAFRAQLCETGVRPLIKHRLYRPVDHAHNARMDEDRYNLRALVESVNYSM